MSHELFLNDFWSHYTKSWVQVKNCKVPKSFDINDLSEYENVSLTGLTDFSYRGKIKVSGNDHVAFLHNILTQDIKSIPQGSALDTAFLSRQGKVLSYMTAYHLNNYFLLDTEMDHASKTIELLNKFIITEDVSLEDVTLKMVHLLLVGEHAKDIFSKLSHSEQKFASVVLSPYCVSFFVRNENASGLAKSILDIGSEYDLKLFGYDWMEKERILQGHLKFGEDFDEDIILSETGLDQMAVSETKGCYPGQEVIARIATYDGLRRKAFKFLIEGTYDLESGQKIISDGAEVGWITSWAQQPTKGRTVALGYLKRESFENENLKLQLGTEAVTLSRHDLKDPLT